MTLKQTNTMCPSLEFIGIGEAFSNRSSALAWTRSAYCDDL
jgi:hypothetical protein